MTYVCVHCSAPFSAHGSFARKYCTPRCKNAAGAVLRRERHAQRPERQCYRCKTTKPAQEFASASHSYCRPCANAYQREQTALLSVEQKRARRRRSYDKEDPARRTARARSARWGLDENQLAEMLQKQGGHCAICPGTMPGGRGTWHVDHDHECCPGPRSCGRCIRGLLCSRCNVGLGHFRDDPALLLAAAAYLTAAT